MIRAAGPRSGAVLAVLAILLIVGCDGTPDASRAPSGSIAPTPSGPGPGQTAWPSTTVEVTIALAAADAEIGKAFTDLNTAAETEDLKLMRGAANGLATLLETMLPRVSSLTTYPGTEDLGVALETSYEALHAAAVKIRDSIDAGDSAGVVAGFDQLTVAIDTYADTRQALADAGTQAIFMKRTLLK